MARKPDKIVPLHHQRRGISRSRWRAGSVLRCEVVSKRFCKKQQMQWSKEGAHLLSQTRVRVLNGELGAIFKRWYPDMDLEVEELPIAA